MTRLLVLLLAASIAPASWPTPVDLQGTVTIAGKAVADAVVWLDVLEPPPPVNSREVVLDQRNLTFFPRVLAVQVGTIVKFPNRDRVFHNAFSFHEGTTFDLGLYPVGAVRDVPFDRPGLSRIFCNIHPQMAAYVMAVDTPHFAVSDDAGRFTIRAVPPDTYTYHAWRPGGPTLNGSVAVSRGTLLQVRWP